MLSLEDTKYCRWYFNIINYRKNNSPSGYVEKHHIMPRSLGGTDDADNIVKLTAREHFVCHLLLTKMFPTDKYKTAKMVRAWCGMSWRRNEFRTYKVNSRIFEAYRKKFSVLVSEHQTENNSQQSTMWIYNVQLKENKKISKDDEIPYGWSQGRVVNWDKFDVKVSKLAIAKQNKVKHETLRPCKICDTLFSNSLSDFCSRICSNKYHYNCNPTLITISKGDKIKQTKPQNYPAYKKFGWVRID